jgi:S-DNA-T family DNA segregation ATPase FtsK/SpoIIIE
VTINFPSPLAVLGWFIDMGLRLYAWGRRHPVGAGILVGLASMCFLVGSELTFDLMSLALATVIVWWLVAHAARLLGRPLPPAFSYDRWVGGRVRTAWRRWWVYERRWSTAMVEARLTIIRPQALDAVPPIKKVTCGEFGDVVVAHLLIGQTLEDWQDRADELGTAFTGKYDACKVYADKPGRVRLEFATDDALAEPIGALPIGESVDLEAVPIGRMANGEPWTVRLLGSHILVAGIMGSGKGSVIWSIMRGVAPAIRDGRVVVWGIDPKGGMELKLGRGPSGDGGLFTRYVDSDVKTMGKMLADAVTEMDKRAKRLAGTTRLHVPTVEEPLILLMIDEFASLTSHQSDSKLQAQIKASIELLLNKGRAVGVVVVGALQNPLKEILPMRDGFPDRVALLLKTRDLTDRVLGEGAAAMGARCDRIPRSLPGCGYVWTEGAREPTRVRAAYVTDDEIREMAELYAPVANRPLPV